MEEEKVLQEPIKVEEKESTEPTESIVQEQPLSLRVITKEEFENGLAEEELVKYGTSGTIASIVSSIENIIAPNIDGVNQEISAEEYGKQLAQYYITTLLNSEKQLK